MKVFKFFLRKTHDQMLDMQCRFNATYNYVYDNNTDICLILYAWTTNKSIAREFQKDRVDEFIPSITEFDEYEFNKFKLDYKSAKLDIYSLNHYIDGKMKKVDVISTFDENLAITDYEHETFSVIIEPYCEPEYFYLKDKFIESLDLFLYTTYHDIFYARDESIEDFVDNQLCYGLTPYGNPHKKILDTIDQLNLFITTFADLFK